MKKHIIHLFFLTSLLGAVSCTDRLEADIDALRNEVIDMESQVSKLNSTLSALSELVTALENNDHIKSISPWMDGNYAISFTSGSYVFLYQGTDGVTPIVGVQYYEPLGNYYWTIQMGPGGKVSWMTNASGQKMRATGIIPQMRIDKGVWEYSFDGKSWNICPWGDMEGKPGTAVFQSIDTSNPYYVTFTLVNGTVFQIPTQKGFDELTELCKTINNQMDSYTKLVNNLDGKMFIKSVAEMQENGQTVGYLFTLEDGSVLQIRNGKDYDFTTQISARQDTDGKYYWIYRTDASQEYQWLIYQGEKVPVTPEDVTPTIGITEIDGVLYFTICYQGGDPELMLDADGNPVQATGRAGFSLIQSAEIGTGEITLTLEDGSVVSLATTRVFIPSLTLSQTATNVSKDSYYDTYLQATVIDTIQMMNVMNTYEAYRNATGTFVTSVAVDGGYTVEPELVSYSYKNVPQGREYTIVFYIPFHTASEGWIPGRQSRVAVFLNWGSNSIMKVASFTNM